MFVQMIRAQVGDEAQLVRALDRWDAELRPGADGFLGSVLGITTAGEAVLVARFESEDAARRNSDRPEQGAWWNELEKAFSSPATFLESSDVDVMLDGFPREAGFVQVLVGKADRERARALAAKSEDAMRRERPDVLGDVTLWVGDGRFVDIVFFTSESDARAAEAKELSEEGRRLYDEFNDVFSVDEYLDVPNPRIT